MCLERYLYLKMKVIDLHTDTLTRKAPDEFNINSNEFMISFKKMKEGNYSAVALAVFLDLGLHKGEMFSLTDRYFDAVDKLLSERKNDFTLFGSSDDSKIQIIRTIEEGTNNISNPIPIPNPTALNATNKIIPLLVLENLLSPVLNTIETEHR